MVYRIEERRITRRDPFYDLLLSQAKLSKNLFNRANFIMSKNYWHNQAKDKEGNLVFTKEGKPIRKLLSFFELATLMRKSKDKDFYALPSSVAEDVCKVVANSWKSYSKLINKYYKDKSSLMGKPKPPKYLDKDGLFNLVFRNISDNGSHYKLPARSGSMPIPYSRQWVGVPLKQVRILPKFNYFKLELVFDIGEEPIIDETKELTNTATIATKLAENDVLELSLVNNVTGEVVKYDFAELSEKNRSLQLKANELNSLLTTCNNTVINSEGKAKPQKTSRRLARIWDKRSSSIRTVFHQVTASILSNLDSWGIEAVDYQKPESTKEVVEDLTYVTLPYYLLGSQIDYKVRKKGILFKEV